MTQNCKKLLELTERKNGIENFLKKAYKCNFYSLELEKKKSHIVDKIEKIFMNNEQRKFFVMRIHSRNKL